MDQERVTMAEKKNIMTSAGAEKLKNELKELKEVRRAEVAQKIKEARAQGDLSENAEYDAAKDEQGEIEARIEELTEILKHAEIVSETSDLDHVFIGAIVKLLDVEFDEEMEVSIVGTSEANSLLNKFDNESPLGQALIGAEVGETVTVDAPAGSFQYKVLSISKTPN